MLTRAGSLGLGLARRSLVVGVGTFAVLVSVAACGQGGDGDAQSAETDEQDQGAAIDFPEKRVELVIPFAPGGGTDLLAREFGEVLGSALDTQVVFQNVEGAGGATGTDRAVKAEPDGYTLVTSTGSALTVGPLTNEDLSYASTEDYSVLGMLPLHPMVIVAAADAPWETLEDFVEASRDDPGALSIAVAGTYSTPGITAYATEWKADTTFNVVPFTGGGADARTALISGQVDAAIAGGAVYKGFVDAGELKVLGVYHDKPYALYPDAPLAQDEGVDWVAASDYFLVGPPGIPDEVAATISEATETAVNDESFREFVENSGYVVEWSGPDESAEILDEYAADMTELVAYIESRQ